MSIEPSHMLSVTVNGERGDLSLVVQGAESTHYLALTLPALSLCCYMLLLREANKRNPPVLAACPHQTES
jgi:hypothetical protein